MQKEKKNHGDILFFRKILRKTLKKKEIREAKKRLSIITPLNKKISHAFRFTIAAQIKLSVFSDETLRYAANNCKRHLVGEGRYHYFYAICRNCCQQNDIKIDTELQEKRLTQMNISETEPKVKQNFIAVDYRRCTCKYPASYNGLTCNKCFNVIPFKCDTDKEYEKHLMEDQYKKKQKEEEYNLTHDHPPEDE